MATLNIPYSFLGPGVVGEIIPPPVGGQIYAQVAWQYVSFEGTVSGTPTDGLTITSYVDGVKASYQPYQADGDPVGTYRNDLAPYEITNKTSFEFTATVEEAGGAVDPFTVNLVDPATLSAEIQYCTVYDVYLLFGSENVNKWADINNLRNTEEIARAIIDQIVNASDYVDTKMRAKYYGVPFVNPYPRQINEITRIETGTNLQTNRGIEDEDTTFDGLRTKAETMIRGILAGQIRLDLDSAKAPPIPGN